MSRRLWIVQIVSLVAGFLTFGWPTAIHAQSQTATLNETLRSVLRCRKEEEFEFVDLVTSKVEAGALKRELVLSMMKWAYEKRPEFPFPYFKEGLTRRAAAIGVEL